QAYRTNQLYHSIPTRRSSDQPIKIRDQSIDDSVQPCVEARTLLVTIQRAHQSDEYLLCHVLHVLRRNLTLYAVIHPLQIAVVQCVKRITVTQLCLPCQMFIAGVKHSGSSLIQESPLRCKKRRAFRKNLRVSDKCNVNSPDLHQA